jgi:hypothetical protein
MREPNPTEPANYMSSYAARRKEMVDIEMKLIDEQIVTYPTFMKKVLR